MALNMPINNSFPLFLCIAAPPPRPYRKRTRDDFNLSLRYTSDLPDTRIRKLKKHHSERYAGSAHPTQYLTQWSLRTQKPVSLRTRSFPGANGRAKWHAEIKVLQRRFINPQSASTGKGARKLACDMACWWVLYGAQLEIAGLLTPEEYSSSSELCADDTEATAAFPELEYSAAAIHPRTKSTDLYHRVLLVGKKTSRRQQKKLQPSKQVSAPLSPELSDIMKGLEGFSLTFEVPPFTFDLPFRPR